MTEGKRKRTQLQIMYTSFIKKHKKAYPSASRATRTADWYRFRNQWLAKHPRLAEKVLARAPGKYVGHRGTGQRKERSDKGSKRKVDGLQVRHATTHVVEHPKVMHANKITKREARLLQSLHIEGFTPAQQKHTLNSALAFSRHMDSTRTKRLKVTRSNRVKNVYSGPFTATITKKPRKERSDKGVPRKKKTADILGIL